MGPLVSFVVPCYRLGHLLHECIASILNQGHTELELLVMDDCSPDNTSEVVGSFSDPRIKYVRNSENFGHIRNYNRGIAASRGKYVWLISADDLLRRRYALEHYVQIMESHPSVGYVFSPAMRLAQNLEMGPVPYTVCSTRDRMHDGREWLSKLIRRNCIVAPSVMVRKTCYENLGAFPVNLPWNGDWYLWCLFALFYDVAYVAEPMVCYREHDMNISHALLEESADRCLAADLAMPWIIKPIAERLGYSWLADECVRSAVSEYLRRFDSGQASNRSHLDRWLDSNGATIEDRAIAHNLFNSHLQATMLDTAGAFSEHFSAGG